MLNQKQLIVQYKLEKSLYKNTLHQKNMSLKNSFQLCYHVISEKCLRIEIYNFLHKYICFTIKFECNQKLLWYNLYFL